MLLKSIILLTITLSLHAMKPDQSVTDKAAEQQKKEKSLKFAWAELAIAEHQLWAVRTNSPESYSSSMLSMASSSRELAESKFETLKKELPCDRTDEIVKALEQGEGKAIIEEIKQARSRRTK